MMMQYLTVLELSKEGTEVKVCSNVKRKPRYWVEDYGKVLFESDDASEAIQWAIEERVKVE